MLHSEKSNKQFGFLLDIGPYKNKGLQNTFFNPPLFAGTKDSQSSGFSGPKSDKQFVTTRFGELAY